MLHGIRPGKARALKVKHVNIDRETILISSTFSGKEIRDKRKGRGARAVEIPVHTEMLLYLSDRIKNNLPEAFIFTKPRSGNHYTETTLRRVWAKARTEAGASPKHIRLYDATRHSVTSQLANQNVSAFQIQNILGHTTVKTTEKYMLKNLDSLLGALSHLSLSDESNAIHKLEKKEKD